MNTPTCVNQCVGLAEDLGPSQSIDPVDSGQGPTYIRLTPQEKLPGLIQAGWVSFLLRYEWDWFITFTFRDVRHAEAADKLFKVWLNQVNNKLYGRRWREHGQGVYWVKALEYQKRGIIHFHVLMSDVQNLNETLRRLSFMDRWNKLAGFSKIEVPNRQDCVTRYCAKYIIKGGEIEISPTLSSYARQL